MTVFPTPPQTVTRFYGNVDYALDTIVNKHITFVHVSTLNDPFDPYFFLETDFDEKRGLLLKYIKKNHPSDEAWFRKQVTETSWRRTMSELRTFMENLKKSSFVFSTSGEIDGIHPRDNLYMWGHYANGHRGVAIEFDTAELSTSALNHHKSFGGAPIETNTVWEKIEYRPRFFPVTAENYYQFMKQEHDLQLGNITTRARTALDDYYDLLGRVKSEVWKPENEWRLLWRNDTTRMKIYRCPITTGSIKTVILGQSMSEKSKSDFGVETNHNFPTAKVLRAEKRRGDLALDFK